MTERTESPEMPAPGGPPSTAERPMEDPHAALERAFIDEFLRAHGHTLRSLAERPPEEVATLLRAAVAHATLRLSEIEARAHYVAELHP
jgi:hypothetical protein